jgi:hypothetical protein
LTRAAKQAGPIAAMTNKATNRSLPTLAWAVLSPSTVFFGRYVKAGKVIKVMELYDPVAHLCLNQYIPGHWLEKAING